MYSHLRNINNLFEIKLLKYNVIEFFMIFKIMGHVYDINIQTATTFVSESFNMTERQSRNACLRKACVLIIVENQARHSASTTFCCKNNRLNIYKHFNFV